MTEETEIMNAYSVVFDGLDHLGPADSAVTKKLVERLRSNLPSDARVADFGCGTGASALVLAESLPNALVLALDAHAPFVARLESAANTRGLKERLTKDLRATQMTIRPVKPEDADQWLSMRTALWPATSEAQHRKEMEFMVSVADRYAVFVCEDQGSLIGFTEVSLREWAEGCGSSPVGYLEGWYVSSHMRRRGTGRMLLKAAEDWARSRGCTEMASDTDVGNNVSEAAHLKLGFQVAAKVIAFRKNLL